MSRKTKSHGGTNMRRSALSFIGANGSLDVDDILQSDVWKNVEMFEKSEAACIQNILNDFDDKITQENVLKAGNTTAKKSPKVNPKSTKKSPMKFPINDAAMDLPGTSLNTNGNIVETKTAKNKTGTASRKPRQTSKTVEEMTSQELPDIDNVEKENFSNASAKENVDSKKQATQEILQDISNITENNLQTSTPKNNTSKLIKKTAKKGASTEESKNPKIKVSKKKSKNGGQHKENQKSSRTNMKVKQEEYSADMSDGEKKRNVNLENNLESNKEKQDTSKNEVEVKKERCDAISVSELENKYEVNEINNNTEKNAKSKKSNKRNQSKGEKMKKKNPENKLQKKSNKSPRVNNVENIKCQCRKSCARDSDNDCCAKTKGSIENTKQHKKSMKAARAIDGLSRRIMVIKKKMEHVKHNLEKIESTDSDSSYTDESSRTSESSCSTRSFSSCSCMGTCSCSSDSSDCTLPTSSYSNYSSESIYSH
ncbi:PREDICTED: dentin sialophosphoprotein-like [Vollenhovia emeryi]|uniref:dentin sialophosphoprotein-like n=1 Tax=Vollenhovia emeryi TaxID=411798 RepID=UPI0005F3DF16|nr:PREDICTED: dentin sialophosphoprotein-like [Vollenhovia emeryi]